MYFLSERSGVYQNDSRQRRSIDGPDQTQGHLGMVPPKTVKAMQSFLGFCNFYWKFIPSFSDIACPLLDLTKQSTPWTWGPNQEKVFWNLQATFIQQPVLAFPNTFKSFTLMMDAFLMALRAVLMQHNTNKDMQPCGYLSQTFSPTKCNYDIFNWELLAVIHSLKEWRQYLLGSLFLVEVLMDHKNLTYFKKPRKLLRRQAWWLLFL